MTRDEIANELVAGCNADRAAENLDKLYSPDAVSVEAFDMGGQGRETKGLEGIRGKHAWWDSAMETHSSSADGPYLFGEDRFAVVFEADATEKESGKRFQMTEVGVYTVADGRITREEFFYKRGPS